MTGYHIRRSKGPDLYLSPYLGEGQAGSEEDVVIKSDAPLDQRQRDQACIAFYSDIEYAVGQWIMDKRYVPRLLVCAGVFLVVYFFGSLVVRDPIPMIDELAVSIIVSVVFWKYLSRRDVASAIAVKEKGLLKDKASDMRVEITPALVEVENFLSHMEAMEHGELADKIIMGALRFDWQDKALGSELLSYARVHAKDTYEWYEKLPVKKHPEILSVRLSDAILEGKVDGPLLGLLSTL